DVRIWIDDGDGFGSRGKLGHAYVAGYLGRLGELRLVRVVRRPPAAAIHAGEAEYRDRDEHGGEDDGRHRDAVAAEHPHGGGHEPRRARLHRADEGRGAAGAITVAGERERGSVRGDERVRGEEEEQRDEQPEDAAEAGEGGDEQGEREQRRERGGQAHDPHWRELLHQRRVHLGGDDEPEAVRGEQQGELPR